MFVSKRRTSDSSLPLLTDVLDGIEAMAKEKGEPVAVVLDEFQHLVVEGGLPVDRQLRAAIQTHEHLSYMFAGSKTRLLTDMTSQHSRPFYRMGSSLFLGPLSKAVTTDHGLSAASMQKTIQTLSDRGIIREETPSDKAGGRDDSRR